MNRQKISVMVWFAAIIFLGAMSVSHVNGYLSYGDLNNSVIRDDTGQVVGFTNEYMEKMSRDKKGILTDDSVGGNGGGGNNDNGGIEITYKSTNTALKITGVSGYWSASGQFYNVVGEVANIGYEKIDFVKLTASYYDQDNRIIGTEYMYTDPTTIIPGESAPFSQVIAPYDVTDIGLLKTIKLVVSGGGG